VEIVYIDIVLINLDKDKERLKIASEHLKKNGIEFERIPGVIHEDRYRGCSIAMVNALKAIPEGGIIFEDDVLLKDFYIPDLPDGWDLLYFGANLQAPTERINDEIVRVYGAWTAHAIMYSEKAVKKILETYSYDLHGPHDNFLKNEFNAKNNCYMVTPMQAYQRPSYSHLEKRNVNYTRIMDMNYDKYIN
jgi:GR25 family glycosyltransferase involved in LPS biosynthesis